MVPGAYNTTVTEREDLQYELLYVDSTWKLSEHFCQEIFSHERSVEFLVFKVDKVVTLSEMELCQLIISAAYGVHCHSEQEVYMDVKR